MKISQRTKLIVNTCFALSAIYLLAVLAFTGFQLEYYYFSCPEDQFQCVNPFFSQDTLHTLEQPQAINCNRYKELCSTSVVSGGESIGTKPPLAIAFSPAVVVGIFISGIILIVKENGVGLF